MIADQMRKLFAFNDWAWQRVFASVEKLGVEDYHAQRLLFEGSIHNTLVHCLSAEYIWLSRLQGVSPKTVFDPQEFANFRAILARWQPVTGRWESFIQSLTDEQCGQLTEYRNTRGNGFSMLVVDILQHVINHATEHRSQLTPVLYHLDLPTLPLDYVYFRLRP
jgi:uncharacterized damage-inducible protein DinB